MIHLNEKHHQQQDTQQKQEPEYTVHLPLLPLPPFYRICYRSYQCSCSDNSQHGSQFKAEYLSVAIERESTTPPDLAMPCTKRKPTNCMIVCEKIHPTVDSRNKAIAIINGRRRPYLSLNGPKTSCPTASPTCWM